MPRLTLAQKLAKDETLLAELDHRIFYFDEVERPILYRDYWPEFADREAPHRLRNLKNRRRGVMKRITQYREILNQ